jgi:hypothetical protein
MSPKMAQARKVAIEELKELCLVEGEDFGVIPGTGTKEKPAKPVLLKPGAEKICAYFGYVPHFEILPGSIEDWAGKQFGEPLFYYHVRCTLMRDGVTVGEGTGSCSSWERKYRYRTSKRSCLECGQQSLIKAKPEWEKDPEYKKRGAWICYEKKGGCGAKYFGDDPEIMDQPLGEVANPDVADIINTVQKMADKRSYVASVLSATGASQWFTQDLEDQAVDDSEAVAKKYGVQPGSEQATQQVAAKKVTAATQEQQKHPIEWRKPFEEQVKAAVAALGLLEVQAVFTGMGFKDYESVTKIEDAREATKVLIAMMRATESKSGDSFQSAGDRIRRMNDKFAMLRVFADLKKSLIEVYGDLGEPNYYDILQGSGHKHANEFRSIGLAAACADIMEAKIKAGLAKAQASPVTTDAHDDWLPEGFGGGKAA